MRVGEPRVAIVGAGWSGATCARLLSDRGVRVEVFEKDPVIGGHSRVETIGGVKYEPNGPHIFHTSDAEVNAFARRYGMHRPYAHRALTEVFLDEDDDDGVFVSWPLQVDELRALRIWPVVERELAELPSQPHGDDFAAYTTSMMGPTLYRLFIHGYTRKQWGRDPSGLSARFAPKRVELRRDGNRRMFRDTWEYFPPAGVNNIIENVLATSAVTCGAEIGVADLDALGGTFDALIVTAPLDAFSGHGSALEWRGIRVVSRLIPTDGAVDTVTPAYQINCPSLRVPYTRTSEPKHATGQRIHATVVSEEHPGADARHYPVGVVDGRNELANEALAAEIRFRAPLPVYFVGRLAEYVYINQDEAIRRSMDRVTEILETLSS